jgi:signal transduction histidine kinase
LSKLLSILLFKPTLRNRLVGLMLLTSMSLITILIIFYYRTERGLYNEFARQTAELSRAVQIGLEGATGHSHDAEVLEGFLQNLNAKGVTEISVISGSDRIIASTAPDNVGKWITEGRRELIFKAELGETVTGDGPTYNVVMPVLSAGTPVGYIHLTLTAEDFSAFLRLNVLRRLIAAMIILAIGTLVAVALATYYTRPIEQLAAAAGKVAGGDLSQQLPVHRRDEIGDLSRSFNHMLERLREDRALRERLRTAEHLASVGQVAKNIAHEIRNPLNFISLSIDHLRDAYAPADPEQAVRLGSLVDNIKGEVQRISRFAESVLEHGRPFELHRRLCDLNDIIDSVLELVAARAQQLQVQIVRQRAPLPPQLLDPELLRTCLYNIVLNAFEAMPAGGTLTVAAEMQPGEVVIMLTDSGQGVGAEEIERIFEPFYTSKSGGLGLGLPLTRKVIDEHGGRVAFHSCPGTGSSVHLHLPLPLEHPS